MMKIISGFLGKRASITLAAWCFVIIVTNSYQCFGANAPLSDVSFTVIDLGGNRNLQFSVNDPARGIITDESGSVALRRWFKSNGIVVWVYDVRRPDFSIITYAGFSVYDPQSGSWKTKKSFDFHGGDVEQASVLSSGGMVTWYSFNTGLMHFIFYDPETQGWHYRTEPRPLATFIDNTGTVAMRVNGGVNAIIYDTIRKSYKKGMSPQLSGSVTWGSNHGTVSYTAGGGVSGTLGYDSFAGFWGSGTTLPRAYFSPSRTSGQAPLIVMFWDLSIGSNSWSWNFGDGGSSSDASPGRIFQSSQGSPFTVTQTASGPGGSNQTSRLINVSPPLSPNAIVGYIDTVHSTTRHATGWAVDPDEPYVSVKVHFYIDGPAGTGTYAGEALADIPRSDVNTTAGYPGNHAFSFPIPSQYFDGNNHTIYAYGIDTSGNGTQNSVLMNSPLTFNFSPAPQRTAHDYNGDGRADQGVFRFGTWEMNLSPNNSFNTVSWGTSGDVPVPADYDGDGKTDPAVRRVNGTATDWYFLQSSNNQMGYTQYGLSTDKPVPADYDGDGKANTAVFRGNNGIGYWYILNPWYNLTTTRQFGVATDNPVPADYDGDGRTDLAVTRADNNNLIWHIQKTTTGYSSLQFGLATDKAVPADYDGDGKDDIAVFRNGTWHLLLSISGYSSFNFGLSGDIPVPADYDGDGKTDIAIYRVVNGTGFWYIFQSSNSQVSIIQLGLANDIPVVGIMP